MHGTKKLSLTLFLIVIAALSAATALAQQGQPVAGYKLASTIQIPGGFVGGDIVWVDSANGRMYLADRGNPAANPPVPPRVIVVETIDDQYQGAINLTAGANGVVAVPRSHQLWVALADSTLVVINTDNNSIIKVISTGGKGLTVTPNARADELAYDPEDRIILVANDRDTPPFITFISEASLSVLKTLNYDGISAPQSTGGLEQPVWNETNFKFYLAVPATKANPNGEIDEIDPQSFSVTRIFPTNCMGPAGLVLIAGQRLMTSCGDIIDIMSGKVLTTVQGVGGDEIWYNPGDQRVYFGGFQSLNVPVVDGSGGLPAGPLAMLVVGQRPPAPAPAQTTHEVAVDSVNNHIYVPVTNVGIQVWVNGSYLTATPSVMAVTGGAKGQTTLTWNAPNAQAVEIHIGGPTGPLFAREGNRGSITTGAWVTDGMIFYLQDVTNGAALTTANTLAQAVVHVIQQ
jgi:hypothetical protein